MVYFFFFNNKVFLLINCQACLSKRPPTFYGYKLFNQGFPGDIVVKNLPAIQGTQVWSLGQEDPLENEMATHSSILTWEVSWTEEPGRL